jgi:prevent-host-death family protein
MATVTASEAKTRLGKLLVRVARGEEIVITKHKKPVARLTPEGHGNMKTIGKSVTRLLELRERIAARTKGEKKLTYKDLKSAIEDGRR